MPFSAQPLSPGRGEARPPSLSEEETAEPPFLASSLAAWASSPLKTLPVPPRPMCWAPWEGRRVTLLIGVRRGRSGKTGWTEGVKDLRLNVLAGACLGGVRVLGHVAGTAAAGGDDVCLEDGCLQVFGLDLG